MQEHTYQKPIEWKESPKESPEATLRWVSDYLEKGNRRLILESDEHGEITITAVNEDKHETVRYVDDGVLEIAIPDCLFVAQLDHYYPEDVGII